MRILVIDDEVIFSKKMKKQITNLGYKCDKAFNLYNGLLKAKNKPYDAIVIDDHLPDGNVVEKIGEFNSCRSSPEIIIVTAESDPNAAELSIKKGAWDYIPKSVSLDVLQSVLTNIFQYRMGKNKTGKQQKIIRNGIIGKSYKLLKCLDTIAKVAKGEKSVLITGETGTGKELFAKAVHMNSNRAEKMLIVADCTSIPEALAESLLFGHLRGSFTGANNSTIGFFLQADKGTLFLDEIGELSLSLQKSFLRVLQEKKVRPIGSIKEIPCDFRLVSATNRDLESMFSKGLFRKDLYYRLNTTVIHLPPLRERKDDIELLLKHNLQKICTKEDTKPKTYSRGFAEALYNYRWPGNVRELINVIETVCTNASEDDELRVHHLPSNIRAILTKKKLKSGENKNTSTFHTKTTPETVNAAIRINAEQKGKFPTFKESRKKIINELEKAYIEELLAYTNKDFSKACHVSGLSRARLYELLKKHSVLTKNT